jgi:hypothetical protein
VTCFKTRERQLDGTLLARWDAAYAEPWLILTDLPPSQADAIWYGLRAWIAGGSKDATRGGWHWEQTKMTDPARAERGWLAMALATLWVVRVGGAAEGAHPAPAAANLPAMHIARQRATGQRAPRTISCFRRVCYRTENPFVSCRVAHRFAGKRKLTGTRLPSRWA